MKDERQLYKNKFNRENYVNIRLSKDAYNRLKGFSVLRGTTLSESVDMLLDGVFSAREKILICSENDF